ncbi:GNAT family N-acetyltransferase [Roseibium sp. RKSG952]|uniref:GNAT family N-acetyltransferase n=1 Tax=Roseibium sp. RKSG952 TaxID=2529384 RepID=UPI0012BB6E77|nr:GNAT family N-acetyltransferase [Roseibium sp. RKSG952]MTH96580.1 GNAT family N-acetyltransferase [Roseibium sp. RKSG952]
MQQAGIELFTADALEASLAELGTLLKACVEDGAGIGFVLPLSQEKAETFWRKQAPDLRSGSSHLLVARHAGRIVGTVMLQLAEKDNGRHRAEVAKLMVHPDARRQGIARMLLSKAEALALELDRSLLTLDTVTGDTAEGLYQRSGYHRVGVIPKFAVSTNGGWDATTIFYKQL